MYTPPAWGKLPIAQLSIEVIKGGAVVDTIDLTKRDHFIAGMFVFDMNSTHGTFVNKTRIKALTFVPVNVGDVVKFGESTRLYVVQGPAELLPEEYDSANLQAARNRAQTRTQRMAGEREARDRSLRRTVDEDGVTWGMSMEEVADVDEDGAASKGTAGELREVDVDDANERDRKLFARVEAKRLKIENLQSEIGRIRAKEVQGELTAGQLQQIERNEARITQLEEDIEQVQDAIRVKNQQRRETREDMRGRRNMRASDDEEGDNDDDDFFDRTGQAARRRAKQQQQEQLGKAGLPAAETVESLQSKVAGVQESRGGFEEELRRLEDTLQQEQAKLQRASEDDPLESFMTQSTLDMMSKRRQALQQKIEMLDREEARLSALLKLAMPALQGLRASGGRAGAGVAPRAVAAAAASAAAHAPSLPTLATVASVAPTRPADTLVGEVPEPKPARTGCPVENAASATKSAVAASAVQPSRSPPEVDSREGATTNAETRPSGSAPAQPPSAMPPKRRPARGPAPPPAAKRGREEESADATYEAAPRKRARPPKEGELEGGEAEWVPPKGQTGDGKTALNERLGY